MRSKWFSRRAIGLHLAVIVWVAVCGICAWWQVGRAIQGNTLSFMYSVEWPVFGILGILGWLAMLNTDKVTEHQRKAREEYEEKMRREAQLARQLAEQPEDDQLAAYNDHLARLAEAPPRRLWGRHT